MMARQSLLDLMSIQIGCMYLSDLRFLSPEQRRYLARKLERLRRTCRIGTTPLSISPGPGRSRQPGQPNSV